MMKKYLISIVFLGLLACVEEFDIDSELPTDIAEKVLVVEAEITNELQYQKVVLSRGLSITRDSLINFEPNPFPNSNIPYNPYVRPINYEQNASVMIKDENGIEFNFSEVEPGNYISDDVFQAEKNIGYQLHIKTSNGEEFISDEASFTSVAQIDNVYAIRELNDFDEEGISIYADGSDPTNSAQFYRYEYEETYKVIAPNWSSKGFQLENYEPCNPDTNSTVIFYDLDIVDRAEEQRVCYGSANSSSIIQNSTIGRSESTIERFPVRFINRDNYIISHRYSILVRQFIQSIEAYSYYQQLSNFASSESLFSEIQPGFLAGNIKQVNGDIDSKVVGYFEVASVTERRVFFDYQDFFPNEPLPPYPNACPEQSANEAHISFCYSGPRGGDSCPQSVVARVDLNLISYVRPNDGTIGGCPGPHVFVDRICGDCTLLGSNIVPDFWEE